MTNLREGAIVVSLVDALNTRGSFCGETHIQKASYFLKQLVAVPMESSFTFYLYGPYSFELHALLNELRAEDLLELESREMGATWRAGKRYGLLQERFAGNIQRFHDQISYVADKVANLNVFDLERYATALWVSRTRQDLSREKRAELIHTLKPRIEIGSARKALETVEVWEDEVRSRILLPMPA